MGWSWSGGGWWMGILVQFLGAKGKLTKPTKQVWERIQRIWALAAKPLHRSHAPVGWHYAHSTLAELSTSSFAGGCSTQLLANSWFGSISLWSCGMALWPPDSKDFPARSTPTWWSCWNFPKISTRTSQASTGANVDPRFEDGEMQGESLGSIGGCKLCWFLAGGLWKSQMVRRQNPSWWQFWTCIESLKRGWGFIWFYQVSNLGKDTSHTLMTLFASEGLNRHLQEWYQVDVPKQHNSTSSRFI